MQREEPGPGQESVWDYPRPPKLEPVPERITVELGGKVCPPASGCQPIHVAVYCASLCGLPIATVIAMTYVFGVELLSMVGMQVVADTTGAYRVLETSHPPTYYLPPKDVDMQQLKPSGGSSYCEWKGSASYYDAPGKPKIAWYYAKPTGSFKAIANYICFYPSKIDKATVGGETVTAQPGEFTAI